jgi:methylmalonyl-CoA/ethylmalonyl-CoA epimerase
MNQSRLLAIDHVGIAVHDLDAAVDLYKRVFGAEVVHTEEIASDKVREALIRVGESYIQLLQPTAPDSPVAKFLERRGEGVHHLGFRVRDCGEALAKAVEAGAVAIDSAPRPGSRGTTVAFLHPKSVLSTLIELVEEGPSSSHDGSS